MFYKALGRYEYGEQQIEQIGTGKKYTACDYKVLFSEDFYSVCRFSYITANDGNGERIDDVFKFNLMPDGYTLYTFICDKKEAVGVIKDNIDAFLLGKADPKKIIAELQDTVNLYNIAFDTIRKKM